MTIKRVDGEFCLFSKDGKKNLGCFPTEKQAQTRERQVNFFKTRNK